MNKLLRRVSTFALVFVFALTLLPSMTVFAKTDKHTVKFRAGDVGSFNKEALEEVYGIVTDNENYFSIDVATGDTLEAGLAKAMNMEVTDLNEFFQYVLNENASYNLKDISAWCADLDKEIKHNTDYVLDYSKLVNPVKYTVYFLDTEDESQIASPWIRYVDSSVTEAEVAPLAIAKYATTNTEVKIDLTAEGEHVVKFYYAYVGDYVHVPSGEEGEVVYQDVIREVVVNAPVVNGNQQNNANNGGQNAGNGNNAGTDDVNGGNGNNEGGNNNGEEPTVIPEEDVPQSGNTQIEDEDVPLWHGGFDENSPLKNTIFIASIGGVVALFAIITTLVIRNQKKNSKVLSDSKSDDNKLDK